MTKSKVEGIVERYAPSLAGHGDHGFSVLLRQSAVVYCFEGVRAAYSPHIGRPSNASSILVELTAVGDHISFEVRDVSRPDYLKKVVPETLRNWTLEQRLIDTLKVAVPTAPLLHSLAS